MAGRKSRRFYSFCDTPLVKEWPIVTIVTIPQRWVWGDFPARWGGENLVGRVRWHNGPCWMTNLKDENVPDQTVPRWLFEIWKFALVSSSYFWYFNDLVLCRTLKAGGYWLWNAQVDEHPHRSQQPLYGRGGGVEWKVTSLAEHWWPVSGALFVGWIFSSVC